MFEPKQSEIDDKVQELLHEAIADDDMLIDALIHCLPEVMAVYERKSEWLIDDVLDLKTAIDKHICTYLSLEALATNALIAEVGDTVRTDVDDYIDVIYDTRY